MWATEMLLLLLLFSRALQEEPGEALESRAGLCLSLIARVLARAGTQAYF